MPISVTHFKSDTIADLTGTITQFNSTGGTATVAATNLVRPSDWNSAHSVSISMAASEIASLFNFGSGLTSSTNSSGISVGVVGANFFEPFILPNTNSTVSAPTVGSWYLYPFYLPVRLDNGVINLFVTDAGAFLGGQVYSSASTGSWSRQYSMSDNIAIYARDVGANSTRLASQWTGLHEMRASWSGSINSTTAGGGTTTGVIGTNALTLSFPVSVDATGNMTYSTSSSSGTGSVSTSTMASTRIDSLISGIVGFVSGARVDAVGFNTTLYPGQYWIAHMFSSNSSATDATYTTGTGFPTQSRLGLLENSLGNYKEIGSSTSGTSTQPIQFQGRLQTGSSAATSAMAETDIRYTTGRMYWNYDGDTQPG